MAGLHLGRCQSQQSACECGCCQLPSCPFTVSVLGRISAVIAARSSPDAEHSAAMSQDTSVSYQQKEESCVLCCCFVTLALTSLYTCGLRMPASRAACTILLASAECTPTCNSTSNRNWLQTSLWAVLTNTAWAADIHAERTAVTTGMVKDESGFKNKPTLDPPTLRRAWAVLLQGCCCTCALWLVTRCTEQAPWPCTATGCMCCNTRCPAHLHVLCCAKQQHTAAHSCRLEQALAQACSPALTCPVALSLLPYLGSAPPRAAAQTRRLLESACNA